MHKLNNKFKNNYKVKFLEVVVCTGACLCLGTKEVSFLCFTNVDPQALTWPFLLDAIDNPNAE
jgi:hypothetical protein